MSSLPRTNADRNPTANFGALGALAFLCAAASALAAVLGLMEGIFAWPWFAMTLLSVVVGVALMWLGDWVDWMKVRMTIHEEGLDQVHRDADDG